MISPLIEALKTIVALRDGYTGGDQGRVAGYRQCGDIAEEALKKAQFSGFEEIGQTERGYGIFRETNEVGGHRYWSDQIGGGVCVWDTSLVASESLQFCLAREARSGERVAPAPGDAEAVEPFVFSYCNWRGETTVRRVKPIGIRFGATEWHPETQWLLRAFDLDKNEEREFAMKDIAPSPAPEAEKLLDAKWLDPECGHKGCQSLVWKKHYEDAVNGRREFRQACKSARAEAEKLREALQFVEDECLDLRCIAIPTPGGDADVHWVLIQHHMSEPREREIGRGSTPLAAVNAAHTALKEKAS